jgi:hypothetical protein
MNDWALLQQLAYQFYLSSYSHAPRLFKLKLWTSYQFKSHAWDDAVKAWWQAQQNKAGGQ